MFAVNETNLLSSRKQELEKQLTNNKQSIINSTTTPPVAEQESVALNFIENISLNTAIDLIKEKLGAPHKIFKEEHQTYLIYNFNEFSLKVATKDNETIDSLTYLLNDNNKQITIIPPQSNPNLTLGKNTFGDYSTDCLKITSEIGAKDVTFYCDVYFGNSGNYWQYRIGIYNNDIPTPSDYQIDENGLIDNQYLQNIKINFISIARNQEDLTEFWYEDFR